ncbi:prolipoprotein diacylglyceryl transferase, partial [bacterium]|nr:prolipoprotein diacylglyceryl transferase [bacterium]
MILHAPSDIAFSIFGFSIYWYGLILASAVLSGVLCAEYLGKKTFIQEGFFVDNSPVLILIGLLGARLYYCVLNFSYYFNNPLEILNIRQGGLSIHGMIIAGVLAAITLVGKDKIKLLPVLDVLACAVPLAQAIGRWGNFFNSEAFGFPTNSSWGLFIPEGNRPSEYIDYELFHPTFLYESLLNIILFCVLLQIFSKSKKTGATFFSYLILYSIVRIFVEYIRIDSALNISGIPIAQLVSL